MFDKLIDFILKQINNIVPYVIILQFQKGVRYTFGKYTATLNPGIHYKIPYIQTIFQENVTDSTSLLQAQSILTQDNEEVIVKAAVGYRIDDISLFYNKVYDSKSALLDITSITIRDQLTGNSCQKAIDNPIGFNNHLRKEVQKKVKKYGIGVNFVSLTDLTKSRSYRLFNESIPIGQ